MKHGLEPDRVVLLGRTLDEYRRFFELDLKALRGGAILNVASGVSSFCAEEWESGLQVTAFDAIYGLTPDEILDRCKADLNHVMDAVRDLKTYRWDFCKSPDHLRTLRERPYQKFIEDYRRCGKNRYVAGRLPKLPFRDGEFALTLVSCFLLVYEVQLGYEFHKESFKEVMRVTSGEARLYRLVTFETKRSIYLDRMRTDGELAHLQFEEVRTDFEFLRNSNYFLRVSRR